jgi:hypothetical protein
MEPESLREACEAMQDELNDQFNLGPGDAQSLFLFVWGRLSADPWDEEGLAARALVEERYSLV